MAPGPIKLGSPTLSLLIYKELWDIWPHNYSSTLTEHSLITEQSANKTSEGMLSRSSVDSLNYVVGTHHSCVINLSSGCKSLKATRDFFFFFFYQKPAYIFSHCLFDHAWSTVNGNFILPKLFFYPTDISCQENYHAETWHLRDARWSVFSAYRMNVAVAGFQSCDFS